MAPLPVTNTRRWKVSYDVGGFAHQFLVRLRDAAVPATVDSEVTTFLSAIGSLFWESEITGVQEAAEGSNLFFPITSGLVGDSWGSGANSIGNNPLQLNFVGRSPGGRRVRVGLFGYKGVFSEWKLTGSESTPVQDAVNALNAAGDCFIAIDGLFATWYPYADIGVNDYWVRQSRKAG